MSYTPDEQYLNPHPANIADSLDLLIAAINERIDDSALWNKEHLDELEELLPELQKWRTKMARFAQDNF